VGLADAMRVLKETTVPRGSRSGTYEGKGSVRERTRRRAWSKPASHSVSLLIE
jgi:hypothetical protein